MARVMPGGVRRDGKASDGCCSEPADQAVCDGAAAITRTQAMRHDIEFDAPCCSCRRPALLKMANLVLVFFLSAAGSAAAQASSNLIRQGLWQIIVTMSVPGMRAGVRPFTHRQCFTSRDVQYGRDMLQINPASPCRFMDAHRSHGRVSWDLQCWGRPAASGHAWLTYGRDRYEGAIVMRIDVPRRGQMSVTEQVRGQRIGACR